MNPQDYELLSAYIDDALTSQERLALEARLANDADLRRELAALRQTVALLRGLPPLKAPRSFTLTPEMVRESPSGTAKRNAPRILTLFSAMSAAAAVLALVFAVALLSSGETLPNPDTANIALLSTPTLAQIAPDALNDATFAITPDYPNPFGQRGGEGMGGGGLDAPGFFPTTVDEEAAAADEDMEAAAEMFSAETEMSDAADGEVPPAPESAPVMGTMALPETAPSDDDDDMAMGRIAEEDESLEDTAADAPPEISPESAETDLIAPAETQPKAVVQAPAPDSSRFALPLLLASAMLAILAIVFFLRRNLP